jgi:hypothetical protein
MEDTIIFESKHIQQALDLARQHLCRRHFSDRHQKMHDLSETQSFPQSADIAAIVSLRTEHVNANLRVAFTPENNLTRESLRTQRLREEM